MKILITPAYFHPHIGGVETHTYYIARELVRRSHDVTVLTSWIPRSVPNKEVYEGIEIVRVPAAFNVYNAPILPGLSSAFLKMGAQIVHTHLPSPYVATLSAALGKLQRVPVIVTYHNDIIGQDPFSSFLANAYNKTFAHLLLGSADKIISTTNGYFQTSDYLRPYSSKVVIIENGVDTDFFNAHDNGQKIKARFGRYIVLFVGSLAHTHRYKGVDYLIRAAKEIREHVPDVQILIVGDGALKPELLKVAIENKVEDIVHFVGCVDREELRDYYSAANVQVLPSTSRAEGFGLVLLEAMAMGKPVVASRIGGIPYFVRDGENGFLIEPKNPKGISGAVSRLLLDPSLAQKMGEKGREMVEERYSWRSVVDRLEALYMDLLEN